MEPVTLMRGATGLHTTASPARLQAGGDEEIAELAAAVNVDVTDTYAVRRRKGYQKRASTGGHSLYADNDVALFVSGNSLHFLASDFSSAPLATLSAPSKKMVYCRAPDPGGDIYFSNGVDRGIFDVQQREVVPWTAHAPEDLGEKAGEMETLRQQWLNDEIDFAAYSSGIEEILRETEDIFHGPPPGITHMEFFAGRLWVATGRFLIHSVAWDFSSFELHSSYVPFTSRGLFVRRVPDGLFVGTEDGVFFLSGTDPQEEMTQIQVSPDRPIEFTDVRARAEDITDQASGDAAIWTTTEGIVTGMQGGQILDSVRPRIDFPSGTDGAGISYNGAYLGLIKL